MQNEAPQTPAGFKSSMFYSSLPLNVKWTFLQKMYEVFAAAFIPSIHLIC